jgi:hypothetical protein
VFVPTHIGHWLGLTRSGPAMLVEGFLEEIEALRQLREMLKQAGVLPDAAKFRCKTVIDVGTPAENCVNAEAGRDLSW